MTIKTTTQDASHLTLPSVINYSQDDHSSHLYTNGVAASPQCEPPARYDGRMTTSARTPAPAPAHDATARAAWLAARAAAPTADARHGVDMAYVRAARVRAVFAGVDTVDAL